MPDTTVLYRDLKGLVNEDLVVEYTVRRVPRGDQQIFLLPASNEETINSADPDESIDFLLLGFDPAIGHNAVYVANNVPVEASRLPDFRVTSSRFKITIKVADILGLGIAPGSTLQFQIDGVQSNAVRIA